MSAQNDNAAMYPQNLVDAVFGITEEGDPEEAVPQVLHCCGVWADIACAFRAARLTEREEKVLALRYMYGQTPVEVGKQFGVTRERIRQVEAKALRKMRRHASAKILKLGMEKYIEDWVDSIRMQAETDAETRIEDFKRNWVEEHPDGHEADADELLARETHERNLRMTIEELDLSVRAYNCMRRACINSVDDLLTLAKEKGIDGFMTIRNLGRKSMEEVFIKTQQMTGIDLQKECAAHGGEA